MLLCFQWYKDLIFLLSSRMEITGAPPHVYFNTESAMMVCKRYLPECALDSAPDLVTVVALALGMKPEILCLCVQDVVVCNDQEIQVAVESWLMNYSITKKQYLCFIVNCRKLVDGLFVWLSVHVMQQHVNILHASGVWTSWRSDITVLTDASVVLILNCCLYTQKMSCTPVKDADPEYMPLLHDPRPHLHDFLELPRALNKPVKSSQESMEEIGLREVSPDAPIQDHFAAWIGCLDSEYCQ